MKKLHIGKNVHNTFERIYQDNMREQHIPRERHPTIELSDQEHLERLSVSKEMQQAGFIYKEPDLENMPTDLKEKFEKARKIAKHTKVVDLRGKDEESKSKSTTSKPKKVHSKANKAAVASLQKKL